MEYACPHLQAQVLAHPHTARTKSKCHYVPAACLGLEGVGEAGRSVKYAERHARRALCLAGKSLESFFITLFW